MFATVSLGFIPLLALIIFWLGVSAVLACFIFLWLLERCRKNEEREWMERIYGSAEVTYEQRD